MTDMADGGFSGAVWAAVGRADVQLSDSEHEALDELIARGEARLRSDLERDAVDQAFDVERAAEELAERLVRRQSAEQDKDRHVAHGSIREWICPLYPIC